MRQWKIWEFLWHLNCSPSTSLPCNIHRRCRSFFFTWDVPRHFDSNHRSALNMSSLVTDTFPSTVREASICCRCDCTSSTENDDKWKLNFILLHHVLSRICVSLQNNSTRIKCMTSASCAISISVSSLCNAFSAFIALIVMSLKRHEENWNWTFCYWKFLPFKSTSRMMELEDWLEKYMLSAALMVLWREARGNFREEREKRLNKWWANFLLQSLYIRILIMLSTSSWQHTKKPAEVSSQGCRWMSFQPASSACCLHCGTKFRLTSFKALFQLPLRCLLRNLYSS